MAQNKLVSGVTPAGIGSYPYLTNPDTKFNPDGEYRVNLILSDGPEAQKLITSIDAVMEENLESEKKAAGPAKAKTMKMATAPYEEVLDDDGEPTGEIKFKFKQKALIRKKDGTSFEAKPMVVDAKRKPIAKGVSIGSGSTLKVAYEISPYCVKGEAGVTLRLKAAQVIELVQFGGQSASMFDIEDGYESSEEEIEASETTGDSDAETDF